jgi:hypothetical protein
MAVVSIAHARNTAYVNVCRFIDVFDTPPKIVLQVYVALLRTYTPETRVLVRKALDTLVPALPRRLANTEHRTKVMCVCLCVCVCALCFQYRSDRLFAVWSGFFVLPLLCCWWWWLVGGGWVEHRCRCG